MEGSEDIKSILKNNPKRRMLLNMVANNSINEPKVVKNN